MDPILDEFEAAVRRVHLDEPRIPFGSNLTAALESDLIANPRYWRRHLREPVRFGDGVRTLNQLGVSRFVEIGPKPTLLNMAEDVLTSLGAESSSLFLMLPSLRAGQSDWQQMLSSLGRLYVSGVNVDWKAFWGLEANSRQRLELPTYPFQRQRYWVAATMARAAAVGGEPRTVPASFGRQRLALANDPAYRLSFETGQSQPSYYRHYRIFGRALFSTGSFLEVMLSTGRDIFSSEQVRVDNAVFERALVCPGQASETVTVQMVVSSKEDTVNEVCIYSLERTAGAGAEWRRHVSARLQPMTAPAAEAHRDWTTWRRSCSIPLAPAAFYAQTAARGIAYRTDDPAAPGNPDFCVLRELWRGPTTAYGHIQMPAALAGEAEAFNPRAMLLDGAIQVAMATFPDNTESLAYLPVGLDQVSLYRPTGPDLWVYATGRAASTPDPFTVDLELVDDRGPIATFNGLTFKQATAEALFTRREFAAPEAPKTAQSTVAERLAQAPADQRPALVRMFVQQQVREVLGLRTGEGLDQNQPLKALGLDSLMTNDLRSRLDREVRLRVARDQIMRSDLTIAGLSEYLVERLDLNTRAEVSPAAPTDEPETEADVAALVPQCLAIVTEQKARQVFIDGRWRCDFASCNYLGLDLHPDVMAAIAPAVTRWGVHPSWTRLVASPAIYDELEAELARFVGARDTLVFPSLSLMHLGIIPVLAGSDGVILKDIQAHNSLIEACERARANGTEVVDFRHHDPASLEERLAAYPPGRTKLIVIDGVYSMSGSYPPLPDLVRIAQRHHAQIYMDDAHGIGVIGAHPSPDRPYGAGGNGVVNYYGLRLEETPIIYTAGLSKSFSSYGAFITCAGKAQKQRLTSATTYIFSGPSPVASLASALAGLRVTSGKAMRCGRRSTA